jgi:hypothetical protein
VSFHRLNYRAALRRLEEAAAELTPEELAEELADDDDDDDAPSAPPPPAPKPKAAATTPTPTPAPPPPAPAPPPPPPEPSWRDLSPFEWQKRSVGQQVAASSDIPLNLMGDAASMAAAMAEPGKVTGWIGKDFYASRDQLRNPNLAMAIQAECRAKGGSVKLIDG